MRSALERAAHHARAYLATLDTGAVAATVSRQELLSRLDVSLTREGVAARGPVLAPVCIASLMIVWGTLVTQWQDRIPATRFTRASWSVSWAGILLALGVFMADSIRALRGGLDTVRQVELARACESLGVLVSA